MASELSTSPASGAVRFTADFIDQIPAYQKVIRRHRLMSWARRLSLDDDLVQLALLDLARVDSRYDPRRATSPHQFRLAVLGSRVSDCAQKLMRMHRDVTGAIDEALDSDDEISDELSTCLPIGESIRSDPVLDLTIRAELVETLLDEIKLLPSRQREVVQLALADLSDREIAGQLGVSVQAANKSRLAAIANLKRTLLGKAAKH